LRQPVDNFVAGYLLLPVLPDETCCFLAIDFDEAEWQKDVSVLRETCSECEVNLYSAKNIKFAFSLYLIMVSKGKVIL